MRTSKNGIDLIKAHEGLRLNAYLCPAGVPTIGYGHTKNVKLGDKITSEQAEKFLIEDLRTAENEVNKLNLNINQNQFDALVSFIFNVGVGNFRKSTLLKRMKINVNDPDIEVQFNKWIYGGGKILPGLVKRRKDEAELYFRPAR